VRAKIAGLEQGMLLRSAELECRMTMRVASVMVAVTGIVLAAIDLPHS
jgi:uncharacterized membrane protein